MANNTAHRLALGLVLSVFCGCALESRPQIQHRDAAPHDSAIACVSASSNLYELTVEFYLYSVSMKPVHKVEIDVRPASPFDVKIQDNGANNCQVSGTLWQMTDDTFQLMPRIIEMKYPGVSFGSSGPEPIELILGKACGVEGVDGGVIDGYSILLTKK
jgi:hypothetical protein